VFHHQNPDETLPEDVEYELSKVMAEAAQKLLAKDHSRGTTTTS